MKSSGDTRYFDINKPAQQ